LAQSSGNIDQDMRLFAALLPIPAGPRGMRHRVPSSCHETPCNRCPAQMPRCAPYDCCMAIYRHTSFSGFDRSRD
jgi:hypothetical protein